MFQYAFPRAGFAEQQAEAALLGVDLEDLEDLALVGQQFGAILAVVEGGFCADRSGSESCGTSQPADDGCGGGRDGRNTQLPDVE